MPVHDSPTLTSWRQLLDDAQARMHDPLSHYRTLQTQAAQLLAGGLIEPAQHHELIDLAHAAYLHAMEERANELVVCNGLYDVIDQATGQRVGQLCRSVLLYDDPHYCSTCDSVDGLLRHDKQGRLCLRSMSDELLGLIVGQQWQRTDGRTYWLYPVAQYNQGKPYPILQDVEACRLALDRLALAIEDDDQLTAQQLRQMLTLAPFQRCPACRDTFAQRDGCPNCAGAGIVPRAGTKKPPEGGLIEAQPISPTDQA